MKRTEAMKVPIVWQSKMSTGTQEVGLIPLMLLDQGYNSLKYLYTYMTKEKELAKRSQGEQ